MTTFEQNIMRGWEVALALYRSQDAGSCRLHYPVERDGTDKTGASDYDCIASPNPDILTLLPGGFLQDYAFSLSVRKSDFPTEPVSGQLFLKDGRVNRILSVEAGDISPIIVLHCGTPDK